MRSPVATVGDRAVPSHRHASLPQARNRGPVAVVVEPKLRAPAFNSFVVLLFSGECFAEADRTGSPSYLAGCHRRAAVRSEKKTRRCRRSRATGG